MPFYSFSFLIFLHLSFSELPSILKQLPVEPPPEVYRTVTSYGRATQRRIPNAYDTTQLKFEVGTRSYPHTPFKPETFWLPVQYHGLLQCITHWVLIVCLGELQLSTYPIQARDQLQSDCSTLPRMANFQSDCILTSGMVSGFAPMHYILGANSVPWGTPEKEIPRVSPIWQVYFIWGIDIRQRVRILCSFLSIPPRMLHIQFTRFGPNIGHFWQRILYSSSIYIVSMLRFEKAPSLSLRVNKLSLESALLETFFQFMQ